MSAVTVFEACRRTFTTSDAVLPIFRLTSLVAFELPDTVTRTTYVPGRLNDLRKTTLALWLVACSRWERARAWIGAVATTTSMRSDMSATTDRVRAIAL